MKNSSKHALRQCLFFTLTAMLAAVGGSVHADTPDHGELAAAVRSAGLPCAHVLDVETAGEDNAWNVFCNSGRFLVVRDEDGGLSVPDED